MAILSPPFDMANPFAERLSGEYFVGREAELSVFTENLKGLKNRLPNHGYVAGLDGTGKSSYLFKLVEIARASNCVGVFLPLDPIPAYNQIGTILRKTIEDFENQTAATGSPPRRELQDDWDLGRQSKLFRYPRQEALIITDLHHDFELIATHVRAAERDGVVICIDEGQRIEPLALSALKNALGTLGSFLIVLSLRLVSDTRGAVEEGRQFLDKRASAAEGDIGASGFYVTGTAMGPFKTDEEVRRLFAARLAHKPIQFGDDVILRLGEIAERVPRKIINLANRLYNRALAERVLGVRVPLLDDCFHERYPDEIKLAVDLCANLSDDVSDLLKALCMFAVPTVALDLVKHAYPASEPKVQALISEGAARQLDRLSMSSGLLLKIDDKYKIANNVYRYALKMVLKIT